MGIAKGPSEGGSGGGRGHSGMEHWGYTHEVKDAAKRRRRISDKTELEVDRGDSKDDAAGQTEIEGTDHTE